MTPAAVDDVAQILASTHQQMLAHLHAATVDEATAQSRRIELERSIEGLGLHVDMISSDRSTGNVGGTPIDLDAMRNHVVQLAHENARATTLRRNIAAIVDLLGHYAEHFHSGLALTAAIDASGDRLHAAVEAREEERRRLSRDIHDGPAQVLTNAIYAIQFIEQTAKRNPQQAAEELAGVRVLLQDGVAEIRRFMFDLRPTMLLEQGLSATVRRYVSDYGQFLGRTIHLHIGAELPALSIEQELAVFRIMQESLQNIHKHAGITACAWVSLKGDREGLTLEIRDNGAGFNLAFATARHSSGSGLPGMRERAALAGGSLEISSAVGSGTNVLFHIKVDDSSSAAGGQAFVQAQGAA